MQKLLAILDAKIFHTIIGACISLITFWGTQYFAGKREKIKYKQTMLSWLVQSNADLFSKIYHYSNNKENINYATLRSELNKTGSFIYILPPDLKKDFEELYLIHNSSTDYYKKNQHRIHELLVSIVDKLHKHGVDAFGNK